MNVGTSDAVKIYSTRNTRTSKLKKSRTARIEALRRKINAGNYNPSATEIADAILKNAETRTE